MENLNAETVKSELEGLAKFRTCPEYIKDALALINSQEQRIKELTQVHEMLSESYDHLEKTKDELLAERSRLTDENEKIGIENFDLICELSRIKEDTVREMKDRLDKHFCHDPAFLGVEQRLIVGTIDQIAKELLKKQ